MHDAGLLVDERFIFHASAGTPAGGREGAEYLLSLDAIPSGIVCYNDFLAVGVYNYLQEKGLRIPQDVSVTGFDNISIAKYLSPPLTTLHQYKFLLGEGAARMMLEVLSYRQREGHDNPPSKKVSLQGVLKIRASTTSIGSRVSNQT
jgi:LacI family transcriptional regulator